MTTQLYTASRLRVIRSCLRMHLYRYVMGLQTAMFEHASFGTAGHKALEAWYLSWQHEGTEYRLDRALASIIDSGLSGFDRAKLRTLIRAYDARWGNEDWEVLAVEQEFRYQLGDRLIGGKIDAIIRNRADGRTYVVEHKTTGTDTSLGSAYWERLQIDTQVSIYIDGASMLGHDIAGCIYDVIKRPSHEQKLATPIEVRKYTLGRGCRGCGGSGGGKSGIIQGNGFYQVVFASEVKHVTCDQCRGTGWLLGKDGEPQVPRLYDKQRDTDETAEEYEARLVEAIAERPDDFLMRGTVVRLDHELPAMRQDMLDDIDIAETGLTPRNSDTCSKYGSLCDFFDLCVGRASVDDEQRFPRGRAHPELDVAA